MSIQGKTLLAGLTWRDQEGNVTRQVQIFGEIKEVIENENTLRIDKPDGQRWFLPYYPETILEALRGEYQCSAGGELVKDPDFIMVWEIGIDAAGREYWQPNPFPYSEPTNPLDWVLNYRPDMEHIHMQIRKKGGEYPGKSILIGIRHYQGEGNERRLVNQEQVFGIIRRVNEKEGIVVQLVNGPERKYPPDLAMLQRAPAGEYTLRSTGEVIVDPDFVMTLISERY